MPLLTELGIYAVGIYKHVAPLGLKRFHRMLQPRSVSGGSNDKSLLDIGQNSFDRGAGALGLAGALVKQHAPFLTKSFQSKLQRDAQ